ncbi:MAG: hypothetical protein HYU59_07600 [Magnetospirillum gryphiswaldense]|nr:hypothetical protein [Magnetospirillum gryphiswaldense]
MKITEENADITLPYTGGKKILLLQWSNKENKYLNGKNIYMIDGENIVWEVSSNRDTNWNGPFTNVWLENNEIHAYRWDGAEYIINPENGFATAIRFLK